MWAALATHADASDGLVLNVAGQHVWSVCPPPRADASKARREASDEFSTCAEYDAADLGALGHCVTLVLDPGDLLFLPRRYVHAATASDDGAAAHLVLGLNGPSTRERCEAAGGLDAFLAGMDGRRRLLNNDYCGSQRGQYLYPKVAAGASERRGVAFRRPSCLQLESLASRSHEDTSRHASALRERYYVRERTNDPMITMSS